MRRSVFLLVLFLVVSGCTISPPASSSTHFHSSHSDELPNDFPRYAHASYEGGTFASNSLQANFQTSDGPPRVASFYIASMVYGPYQVDSSTNLPYQGSVLHFSRRNAYDSPVNGTISIIPNASSNHQTEIQVLISWS